jgi:hypothetical protein
MREELKSKIITYNKAAREKADKAADMDIIVAEIKKLPFGQLKKVLSDELITLLTKYGIYFE